jgi:hypothetical protein
MWLNFSLPILDGILLLAGLLDCYLGLGLFAEEGPPFLLDATEITFFFLSFGAITF